MTFDELLDGVEVLDRSPQTAAAITGVQYDSRKVKPGDLFVAMRGETTDGNKYIDLAITSGATAVVTDAKDQKARANVAWAQVPHGRRALARMVANFFRRPAEKMAIVGITGTNGKTTTSYLVEAMLNLAGHKTALIGTIEYRIAGEVVPSPHTTPESLELNQFFAQALKQGAKDAVMEVSSHALEQGRVYTVPFDVAVFTNLTRDHLDYHQTMESYFSAKQLLFGSNGTNPPRVAVINQDDEYGKKLFAFAKSQGSQVYTYGYSAGDVHAKEVEISSSGTRFEMQTPKGSISIFTPLAGKVNVYNVLAASGAALARGCDLGRIAEAVLALTHVPGRFQRVVAGQPFTVVVDYAHTDDALKNLVKVAREFVQGRGKDAKVITVFGCGGDRDKTKRPLMGKAAGEGSDFVVLTSDNPRGEDPLAIMHDVIPGIRATNGEYTMEPDRRRAISLALRVARPGDIVLIAGKGHEKFQISSLGREPFDDVQVVRKGLYAMGFTEDFAQAIHSEKIGTSL